MGKKVVRLFTAIDLPEEQGRFLHRLARELSGVRVTPQAQLHLTLNFIGEVDMLLFHKLRQGYLTVTAAPFSLSLQDVGTFPAKGTANILWAGVAPCQPLLQLQQLLKERILDTEIAQEARVFHPHITLARIKNSSREQLSSFCKAHASLALPPFEVTAFNLYSSSLFATGVTHTLEQRFRLEKNGAASLPTDSK
ncbi:MAG: RNA 2',3'-cyclic phosphodiesterase [Proteobacteria bacterium]|nr:RNA 2',3'-cyclic phosphodiesterase [Pseudomonadota bacterium]MBU1058039.1 RNA 2',3'-cyclic phosphodiesterase [Pseudomonadota bacterium]